MKQSVTIAIPVYNAFAESRECVQSVLDNSPDSVEILVIDDASTEGNFADYVSDLLSDSRIKISRNSENLGFVLTCNKAMRSASPADVILLNSDTVVTRDWVHKLSLAAYSDANVGTVTPLTNNGVICSVPNFCRENSIPADLTIDQLASLIEEVGTGDYEVLPTCVGFCVYIKRQVIEAIGYFDEKSFGKGYGEENDFSLRAQQAGFVDLLDHKTFVYHKGNCSFLGLREETLGDNEKVIRKRYPHYMDRVSKFCSRNPLKEIHQRIHNKLVDYWCSEKKRVLHVLHNGPFVPKGDPLGGTEIHCQDLILGISSVAHWSLVATRKHYHLTCHIPGFEFARFFDKSQVSLDEIISTKFFDVFHLHQTMWFDHADLCRALAKSKGVVVSFHDYTLGCPRHHMLTPELTHCNGFECVEKCGYRQEEINQRREVSSLLVQNAARLCCFSDSSRSTVQRLLDVEEEWQKIPHGIPSVREYSFVPEFLPDEEPLRIACVGNITNTKGAAIFEKLFKVRKISSHDIEWHVFGSTVFTVNDEVLMHGEYRRSELNKILCEIKPHLALFLSPVPETYMLTLDEVLSSGIPAIVGPLGAPAERISVHGAGGVLSDNSPASVLKALEDIIESPKVYNDMVEAAKTVPLLSIQEECESYSEVYADVAESESSIKDLLQFLDSEALIEVPRDIVGGKILRRLINKTIYFLDSLGIRGSIQRKVQLLLPDSIVGRLKRIR